MKLLGFVGNLSPTVKIPLEELADELSPLLPGGGALGADLAGLTAPLDEAAEEILSTALGGGAPAETILVAGAISPANAVSYLSGASGSYAVTLAAPNASMIGKTKLIEYTVGAGVVTLNAANIDDTGDVSPTLDNTFSVVGQCIVLLGLSTKWLLIEQAHTTA